MRNEAIANGKETNEEDYTAACQDMLRTRSDIKTKIEAPLKSGDAGAFLRSLEDAEQRLADARVNSTAGESCKSGASPQKESELPTVEKEHENQKLDDYRESKSLPKEGLNIRDRTQSNRTSISSKSTTTKRVMLLDLEALKKQEEIDEQIAAKKRQAEIRKKHEEIDNIT